MKINSVYSHRNGYSAFYHGYMTSYAPEIHEEKPMPQTVGCTPVGLRSWYKHHSHLDVITTDDGVSDKYCPMRGSKTGIAALNCEGLVHDYTYYTQIKLAEKFYAWHKRTGKRFMTIRCRSKHKRLIGCKQGAYSDFMGRLYELFYDETGKHADRNRLCILSQVQVKYGVCGDIVIAFTAGLEDDSSEALRSLARELIKTSYCELAIENNIEISDYIVNY